MHDSMQYDPIQGQGQGHEPFKVGNLAVFKSYLLRYLQWELATDHGFLNCHFKTSVRYFSMSTKMIALCLHGECPCTKSLNEH